MTPTNAALMEGNRVVNVIVVDADRPETTAAFGAALILLGPDDAHVGIGWVRSGDAWSPPGSASPGNPV